MNPVDTVLIVDIFPVVHEKTQEKIYISLEDIEKMPKTFTDFRENRAQDMIKYYDSQKMPRTMMLKYDRNPTKIVSALKQMGKRLKLTAKKKGKEYAIKGDLRDLNMFMRYLNTIISNQM